MKKNFKRSILRLLAILPILSISFAAKSALEVIDLSNIGNNSIVFKDKHVIRINGNVYNIQEFEEMQRLGEFEKLINLRESRNEGGSRSWNQ
jgi:conjugal transfer/entry exclusion protein